MNMEEDNRLTVIIPGYNTSECCWKRCVESVRNACGPKDRIICVDDGSTVPVREKWVGADVDLRVRLVRKENGGLSSARNYGMDLMRGKYVTFVDSDDEVRPETFDRCAKALEKNDADIAVYGVEVIWVDEGLRKIDKLPDCYFGALDPSQALLLQRANLLNYAWNKVYKIDFITGITSAWNKKISFDPNGMPCEDTIFNLNCIMAGARWCNVDYVGYKYYRTNGSLLASYKPSNIKGERAGSEAWKRYKDMVPGAREIFGKHGEASDDALLELEWRNIWRPMSPFSLVDRWRWLMRNPRIGGWAIFVRMMLFSFARQYLYLRPIRRWQIRRLYPNAENFN